LVVGPAQAFGLHEAQQALTHAVVFVHIGQWLNGNATTGMTLKAPPAYQDTYPFGVDGQIHKPLLTNAVGTKHTNRSAQWAGSRQIEQMGADAVIVVVLFYQINHPMRPVQEVHNPLNGSSNSSGYENSLCI
jgi:hypothetical protein